MAALVSVTRIDVDLGPAYDVGRVPTGYRRIIPLKGGSFVGERLRGEVLPAGADWNLVRHDEVMELSALYPLRTHDGYILTIHNVGIISAPGGTMEQMTSGSGAVDGGSLYSRLKTHFEAPIDSPYDWLNRALFCGVLLPPESMERVSMEIFRIG